MKVLNLMIYIYYIIVNTPQSSGSIWTKGTDAGALLSESFCLKVDPFPYKLIWQYKAQSW